jgi:DNA polymerase-1
VVSDLLNKPKVILIDGGCVGARAVFTVGQLSFNEIPTGVIYGFLKEIQRVAEEYKTNDFMYFWDSKKSHRKKLFPDYKVKRSDNRTKKEIETWKIAHEQYDELREEILPYFGWTNQFLEDGYEADDLLHQAAVQLSDKHDVIMVTSDQDMYQSLDYCTIYNPSTRKEYDRLDLLNQWGVAPDEWGKVKTLAGCKSDEVPGVPGVGEKTAIKFLRSELKRTTKVYNVIMSDIGREATRRNKPLVVLPFENTPELEFYENEFDFEAFVETCDKLGMASLMGHYSQQQWRIMLNGAEPNCY